MKDFFILSSNFLYSYLHKSKEISELPSIRLRLRTLPSSSKAQKVFTKALPLFKLALFGESYFRGNFN